MRDYRFVLKGETYQFTQYIKAANEADAQDEIRQRYPDFMVVDFVEVM